MKQASDGDCPNLLEEWVKDKCDLGMKTGPKLDGSCKEKLNKLLNDLLEIVLGVALTELKGIGVNKIKFRVSESKYRSRQQVWKKKIPKE